MISLTVLQTKEPIKTIVLKRIPINQISEPLWINQDDILTPDEKLVDVTCVNFAKILAIFRHTGLQ